LLEKDLQRAVIDLAHLMGWRVAHFRPAQTARGWRTAVEADGKGFPDLVLTRGGRVMFRELKCNGGKASPEQEQWLRDLTAGGQDAGVWTDRELRTRIVDELR
jgi:hypothetical protein